ncbi:glycosyltransferase [Agrococcus beijingensis]|uniref:glycosyltransferase n=1 Tax=Agrococcus beijingensis TaxID=3068634 RepID=UPI0027406185|nr:glycosyltransferase [Agrococcus sp. REN33]
MIGYYIHHRGRGHLSRALAIAAELEQPVTGLSSLAPPAEWRGDWLRLPADGAESPVDAEGHGRLHWAPLGHAGLRTRMARIAGWIDERRPRALVVDVSVEVGLLARLHGVPVVTIAMPGQRTDAAHELGFALADAVIGAWPPQATGMADGLPDLGGRLHAVGAISRFAPVAGPEPEGGVRRGGARRVVVLGGAGGDTFTADAVGRARDATPGWAWTHLGANGSWTEDPWATLVDASVVVTHAGESAIAEVAAARRPAIVIPQPRPHDEQLRTAAVLADARWPTTVVPRWPTIGWPGLLHAADELDGGDWQAWNDGGGAHRAAAIIAATADRAAST